MKLENSINIKLDEGGKITVDQFDLKYLPRLLVGERLADTHSHEEVKEVIFNWLLETTADWSVCDETYKKLTHEEAVILVDSINLEKDSPYVLYDWNYDVDAQLFIFNGWCSVVDDPTELQ